MLFTKMNGLGNDYIFIDSYYVAKHQIEFIKSNHAFLVPKLSDRNFGIGGDGVVLVEESSNANAKMSIYNSDGSLAKMCGNALRCIGKILCDRYPGSNRFLVETLSGTKKLEIINSFQNKAIIETEIGSPRIVNEVNDITFINVGNDHAVIYVKNLDDNVINRAKLISNRYDVNVEVALIKDDLIQMRVWERGAGETLACGTGASAVAYNSFLKGFCGRNVKLELKGGCLLAKYHNDSISLVGEAAINYIGEIDLKNYG